MPKQPKRKIHTYSEENLRKALEEVKNGAKIRETCRAYGVPRSTLQDRIKGRVSDKPRKMGPDPFLTLESEKRIVDWLIQLAKCGFPIKKQELLNTVQKIVLEEKVTTPFKNGKPGQRWYSSFLLRHPQISARTAESIDTSRAKLTEEYIRSWFHKLEEFLDSIGATDILTSPSRIFNADESGFSLCPKSGRVLGPKGFKNFYEVKKGNEKENITVLLTISADGRICPVCVVYPYKKPPRAIVESLPDEWILGKSESGWMRSDVFFDFVKNGLNEWVLNENIQKPILFFVDGHRSHMSIELSQFCDENRIILYSLPPNATHIMQPADVAVFKPLKEYWRQAVRSWQNENVGKSLTKFDFAPVLKIAVENQNLPEHIRKGFRRCGLFPFDCNAPDYTKCVQNSLENLQPIITPDNDKLQCLSSEDFQTTYKVLDSLKEEMIHKVNDIDLLLQDLKTYEKKKLENNLTENEINEYEVNEDGTLSLVQANKINILRVDIIPPPKDDNKSDCISITDTDIENVIFENLQGTDIGEDIEELRIDTEDDTEPNTTELTAFSASDKENATIIISDNQIPSTKSSQEEIPKAIIVETYYTKDAENETDKVLEPNEAMTVCRAVLTTGVENEKDEKFLSSNDPIDNNKKKAEEERRDNVTEVQEEVSNKKDKPIKKTEKLTTIDKHLIVPKPIEKNKRAKAGPSTSAISSKAWRDYYINKDNEKLEKENIKKRKREEMEKRKLEKATKNEKKLKAKDENDKLKNLVKKKVKCALCLDVLESDAEEEGEKNVGCDLCPRWFHLYCTKMAGETYDSVTDKEFFCDFCCESDQSS